jgi:hypothetical protein
MSVNILARLHALLIISWRQNIAREQEQYYLAYIARLNKAAQQRDCDQLVLLDTTRCEADEYRKLAEAKCREMEQAITTLQAQLSERDEYIETQRTALDQMRDEGTKMLAQDHEADVQLRASLDGLLRGLLDAQLSGARAELSELTAQIGETGRAAEAEAEAAEARAAAMRLKGEGALLAASREIEMLQNHLAAQEEHLKGAERQVDYLASALPRLDDRLATSVSKWDQIAAKSLSGSERTSQLENWIINEPSRTTAALLEILLPLSDFTDAVARVLHKDTAQPLQESLQEAPSVEWLRVRDAVLNMELAAAAPPRPGGGDEGDGGGGEGRAEGGELEERSSGTGTCRSEFGEYAAPAEVREVVERTAVATRGAVGDVIAVLVASLERNDALSQRWDATCSQARTLVALINPETGGASAGGEGEGGEGGISDILAAEVRGLEKVFVELAISGGGGWGGEEGVPGGLGAGSGLSTMGGWKMKALQKKAEVVVCA